MKSKFILIIILTVFISCDKVKVTNSNDDEAVPVRMIGNSVNTNPPQSTTNHSSGKKIIDYKIVQGQSEIESKIKIEIASGWQPLGGITYYPSTYYQAMVKYEQ